MQSISGLSRKTQYKLLLIAVVGLLFASLMFLNGCGSSKDIAAKVNGEFITTKTLDAEVEKMALNASGETMSDSQKLQLRSAVLEELISQKLLEKEAKRLKIEVSPDEIDSAIELLKARYADDKAFEEALKKSGLDQSGMREQVRWQLIATKVVEREYPEGSLSDEEILNYYEENAENFKVKAGKRASHILYSLKDKDKAEAALENIKKGEDFEAIAKRDSIDGGTKQRGGDLGWLVGTYVPEFQAAVDKLKVGDAPLLVKSMYGYHIVLVTDERSDAPNTIENNREEVERACLAAKRSSGLNTLLSKWVKEAKIEVLDTQVLNFQNQVLGQDKSRAEGTIQLEADDADETTTP